MDTNIPEHHNLWCIWGWRRSSVAPLAVSPTANYVYTANGGNFYTVSTTSNVVTNTISNTLSFTGPGGMATNPQGTLVYVTSYSYNTVTLVNVITDIIVNTITIPSSTPVGIVFNPTGTLAYVEIQNFNEVGVITVASNTVTTTITGFGYLGDDSVPAFNPAGNFLYIPQAGIVKVVSPVSNTIVTRSQ